MVEIVDQMGLKAWLKQQPQAVSVTIAARAALRALPLLADDIGDASTERMTDLVFSVFRCTLISAGAAVGPPAEMRRAADAADAAAFSAARAAATADAFAFADAAADAAAFSAAAANDATLLELGETPDAVFHRPLWHEGAPERIIAARNDLFGWMNTPEWAFWRRWYDAMLHGRPLNWDMQRDIARLPPEDWDQGPVHIAALIARIEADYLRDATPFANHVAIDTTTGLWVPVVKRMDNVALFETAKDKIWDAVDDLRPDEQLSNKYTGLAHVIRRLDRCQDRYQSNPQRLHDDFILSVKQLKSLAENNEYQQDENTEALEDALIAGSDDIRAAMPDVRAAVTARAALRIEELRVGDTDDLTIALAGMAGESVPELATPLTDDAATIAGDNAASSAETRDALYRSAANISRGYITLREFRRGVSNGTIIAVKATGGLAVGTTATVLLLKLETAQRILLALF